MLLKNIFKIEFFKFLTPEEILGNTISKEIWIFSLIFPLFSFQLDLHLSTKM